MVAEACQESGTIYTGSTYNGYGDIYHKNLVSGPYVSLCDITPPWTGTPIVDELLTEDIPKIYSSGSEYYVITMHDAFIGAETKSAEFTECWYTDDGNRYVKTSGSNSLLGNNWANAWLTLGYGFQNIPSGKDLYIEEGLYGSETLSNVMNPPQTTGVYIQPSGHTEAQCNVWINDKGSFNFGDISSGPTNLNISGYTYIQTDIIVPHTGILSAFDMNLQVSPYGFPGGTYIFKIFRDDGTYYRYIGEGEVYVDSTAGLRTFNICNIDVQAGDLVAIYCSANNSKIKCSAVTDAIRTKSGNITTDTLKSAWGTISYKMRLQAHGFKSL